MRALERTAPIVRNPVLALPMLIDDLGERFGAAPALIDDSEFLSYRALAKRAGDYARWALDHGRGSTQHCRRHGDLALSARLRPAIPRSAERPLCSARMRNIESLLSPVLQLYCALISRLRARAADGGAASWRRRRSRAAPSTTPGVAAGVDPKTSSATRA